MLRQIERTVEHVARSNTLAAANFNGHEITANSGQRTHVVIMVVRPRTARHRSLVGERDGVNTAVGRNDTWDASKGHVYHTRVHKSNHTNNNTTTTTTTATTTTTTKKQASKQQRAIRSHRVMYRLT